MTIRAVAKKDFRSARRSRALWAITTGFALLTALIAYAGGGFRLSGAAAVRSSFQSLGSVLAVLLPIAALVASYMAIAGERKSGGIKFLLAFPNTRRDVFLGKLASRLLLVCTALLFVFVAATSIAVARYGALPLGPIVGLFALSLLYGSVFVSVAIAFSSAVGTRSRAIGGAVGSYFVLVVLYIFPGIRVSTIVQWVHNTILGFEQNVDLYNAITLTSPFIAFRKSMNLVFPEDMEREVLRRSGETAGELPVYLSDEFALVVFALWLVVPLALGYLRFERSDLT